MTSSPFSRYPIIVHSHLRWDWVWQRPQQFLSRLSKRHRILFVEGPQLQNHTDTPYWELSDVSGYPNITVMRTFFPEARFGEGARVDAERRSLLDEVLTGPLKGKFERPVQWFYDPMAVTSHMGKHGEILAVYDCMDELSQFKFAPPEISIRERKLLDHAGVVFTGGRKMWESKSRYNSNTHFYGCGVDVAHFGQARLESTPTPEDIKHLEGPILGYFGVVDERLDYGLVARLADANPDWHVVMVGPFCKVDPAQFPQRENLHWLGGRPYAALPGYCKAFNVCLMPFARNESTEYINPTKALEYMASGTPVVSTAVPDVCSNFSSVVFIGEGDGFIQHCLKQVESPDASAVQRGLAMANENTWDDIVAKLEKHIEQALVRRTTGTATQRAVEVQKWQLVGQAA